MGTRNLTIVVLDGEYKIAQYGQWDGYPKGQGITCLNFARKLEDEDVMKTFIRKLRSLNEYTEDDIKGINEKIKSGEIENWEKEYPALTRNTGGEILNFIFNAPDGEKVRKDIEFAADSLFCEWAWLIDLDNNTFEAYEGSNKTPLTKDDRFYFLIDKEDSNSKDYFSGQPYHCIKKVAEWDLEYSPSDEEFFATFETE